jgi:hypothetical protein
MGRQAVIDTAVFPYYALKASQVINHHACGNIIETEQFIDEVQMCCCELAEELYNQEKLIKSSNGIASEKVGEYSVNYVDGEKTKIASVDAINSTINRWLLMTGLLYRGC